MDRDTAIRRLIDLDVARWGEGERAASTRMRSCLSHGRALNSLAYYDCDRPDMALAAEAQRVMTDDDHRALRQGG